MTSIMRDVFVERVPRHAFEHAVAFADEEFADGREVVLVHQLAAAADVVFDVLCRNRFGHRALPNATSISA